MEVAIFDAYAQKKQGGYMHFNIIVAADTEYERVLHFGKEYLQSKVKGKHPLSARECRFCHTQEVIPAWEKAILLHGYYIYEKKSMA